jgi:hypothetical protein
VPRIRHQQEVRLARSRLGVVVDPAQKGANQRPFLFDGADLKQTVEAAGHCEGVFSEQRGLMLSILLLAQRRFPALQGTTEWLGEPPGGKRGQNRTSADAAIWWGDTEGCSRLTLVGWKYTERQFGTCGGFTSRGNDQKATCTQWRREDLDARRDCYLERRDTSRNQRK